MSLAWLWAGTPAAAQDLEPRAYSVAPVGTNIVVFSYISSQGDLAFDPTLPIEDSTASTQTGAFGYFRSIDFLGRTANVAVQVPYVVGTAEGLLSGEFAKIRRSGMPSSRLRFGVNLFGAPAMNLEQFTEYRQDTTLGLSLVVVPPTGQYDPSKLINLSSNRWAYKPELGLSKAVGKWILDFYAGAWLFSTNNNALGSKLEQRPIATTQFHVSYSFQPRMWLAFDANFFAGGRTVVDGEPSLTLQRNSRVGATFSLPIQRRQSLSFSFSAGAFTTIGADFNRIGVAYQFLWGGGL